MEHSTSTNNNPGFKGQASTTDFIVGLVLLIVGVLIGLTFVMNLQEPSRFVSVKQEALVASDYLLSQGFPIHWTNQTVIRVGLLSGDQLNQTKLKELNVLPYPRVRSLLTMNTQIYGYFEDNNGVIKIVDCGFGSPDVVVDADCNPQVPVADNVVKITRFVAYNDSIVRLVVITWD
jgi:hypothetical protein